jgi:hypothetical protein
MGGLHGRQQQGNEDASNGYHDQELDERNS